MKRTQWILSGMAGVALAACGGSQASSASAQAATPAAAPAAAPASPPASGGSAGEARARVLLDTHLRPLAPGVFEYTEELFDALVEQNAVLLSGTHLEPVAENGQVVGLRLFGVRAEGPLARLGLQNGDVVRSLNGHGVGTPAGALEAYSAVRRAPVIEVLFTRAGAEQRVRLQRRN